nr:uncharacterized protein CTRU02_08342 [Colletotrichum truncatum]KAF6790213.1 hypothetical protein CTRU02_08342 [Colletotrichum truncatum]
MTGKYLITGGYLATLDDSLGDFANGAILVEDGVIKAVGKAEEIKAPDAEIIDATDGVIIPGMVDTHRHVSMSLTRCGDRPVPAVAEAAGLRAAIDSLVGGHLPAAVLPAYNVLMDTYAASLRGR